jgi:hypothetical protein
MTIRMLTAIALCSAMALAACQKKAEPAADATAADTAAPAATPAMTPAAGTPAECQTYLDHVNACVTKLSAANPAVADSMKQSLEQTRASWAQITDQAALASACKPADDAYMSTAQMQGC